MSDGGSFVSSVVATPRSEEAREEGRKELPPRGLPCSEERHGDGEHDARERAEAARPSKGHGPDGEVLALAEMAMAPQGAGEVKLHEVQRRVAYDRRKHAPRRERDARRRDADDERDDGRDDDVRAELRVDAQREREAAPAQADLHRNAADGRRADVRGSERPELARRHHVVPALPATTDRLRWGRVEGAHERANEPPRPGGERAGFESRALWRALFETRRVVSRVRQRSRKSP